MALFSECVFQRTSNVVTVFDFHGWISTPLRTVCLSFSSCVAQTRNLSPTVAWTCKLKRSTTEFV